MTPLHARLRGARSWARRRSGGIGRRGVWPAGLVALAGLVAAAPLALGSRSAPPPGSASTPAPAAATAESVFAGGAVEAAVTVRLTGTGPEWDLPNADHPRVDHWIREFTTNPRMRERYQGFLDRGGAWVPHMMDRLDARGMPLDLIYLSMVESGFRADAISRAGAVGMWQFLRGTGQEYGLAVDRAVDERRDPVRATEAGLDYLERLHDRFGSWYLAMAAYNGGQNRIARIMRQTLGRERARSEADYYRVRGRLPRETQDYIPLIIAAARIGKDPEAYGFRPMTLESPVWEEVTFAPATPLDRIAALYGTTVDEIRGLNPHLLIHRTPDNRDYVVRLPEGSLDRYASTRRGARGRG
jgi:membrane-bound lytic murein transglycosylase D